MQLFQAAKNFYGSWCNTLKKVGIDLTKISKRHAPNTKKEVDEFIKHLYQNKQPVRSNMVMKLPNGIAKYRAGKKFYGSWDKALIANGVPVEQAALRKPGNSLTFKITKENIDNFIKSRFERVSH